MNKFQDRHKYLGASEIGQALSLSRYGTARELWEQKTLRAGPPPHLSIFERGHFMESAMVEILEKKYGIPVSDRQLECICPDRDWIRSHLDGKIPQDSPHIGSCRPVDQVGMGIVEFKAPGHNSLRSYDQDGIPAYYIMQMHFNMYNAGATWGLFVAMDYENWDIIAIPMQLDKDLVLGSLPFLDAFWACVQQDVSPTEKNPSPRPIGPGRESSAPLECSSDMAVMLQIAELAKKNAEDAFDIVRGKIQNDMTLKDHDHIIYRHKGVSADVRWSLTKPRQTIDGKKLRDWTRMLVKAVLQGNNSLTNELARKYDDNIFTKTSAQSRRFSFKIKED